MEISREEIERLKRSWGDRAEAMACSAIVCYADKLTQWQCYIYAMNPKDEDQICCLIVSNDMRFTDGRLSELLLLYNINGDYIERDKDFRPMRVRELIRKLKERGLDEG